jgi:hypothetical protein
MGEAGADAKPTEGAATGTGTLTLLQSILTLCRSLHGCNSIDGGASSSSSSLSLRQLVPVHASIIRATKVGMTNVTASTSTVAREPSTSSLSLQGALDACGLVESDRALCESILVAKNGHEHDVDDDHGDEAAKLLAIQYLLDSVSVSVDGSKSNPLPGLALVVLPLLLATTDTDTERYHVSDELAEAVLHALFLEAATESSEDEAWLQVCLEQCMQKSPVPDEQGIRQKRTCRVLHRLFLWTCNSSPTQTAVVLKAVTDKIIQGVDYAVVKPEEMAVTLRPVTNDLLPLLIDNIDPGSQVHVERVWACIWKCYGSVRQQQPDQQQSAPVPPVLIVVTTVLCTILPSLLDRSLPGISQEQAARPLNQPAVWELILLLLNQGIQVPKKASWVEDSWKTQTATVDESSTSSQLLRRRGLYLLRIMTAPENKLLEWHKYVACFETLEMEFEPHLVDQVWETVAELCSQISEEQSLLQEIPPLLSWSWMSVLLARIISSYETPILRKLGLYRLFKGQAGIVVDAAVPDGDDTSNENDASASSKKKKTRNTQAKPKSQRGLPLQKVSTDFVLGVILPSFGSLLASVGTTMHLEENRKVVAEDMIPLLSNFLDAYIQTMVDDSDKLEEFFRGLLSPDIVCKLPRKTAVHIFSSIADNIQNRKDFSIPIQEETLKALVQSFRMLFSFGSVVLRYREALLQSLATMLAHSQASGNVSPLTILSVLALYPSPVPPASDMQSSNLDSNNDADASWIDQDPALASLRQWLLRLGQGSPSWARTVGSAVSTAFVDGVLLASSPTTPSVNAPQEWDPASGATDLERDTGKAVALFCALATVSASELMWPAIHKGLARASVAMVESKWLKADCVTRALLLLERGCKLQVLSGMGNGDLMVDRKTQQMMSPPQNIETMLSSGVSFIMRHVHALLTPKSPSSATLSGRSGDAKRVSTTFAALVSQLQTLHAGFPSSMAVSGAVDGLLKECIEALSSSDSVTKEGNNVQRIALVYAALSCGGEVEESSLLSTCKMVLNLQFFESAGGVAGDGQSSRSVFQYAKWGALSILLPRLFDSFQADTGEVQSFLNKVFDETSDAVEATPVSALVPLFRCVVVAASGRFSVEADTGVVIDKENLIHLEKIIGALFRLMDDCKNSADAMFMLDEISALLFQPHLLLDENTRILQDADCQLPLRDAFRELMKIAGRCRPHVSRAVLCRIASGWLGSEGDAGIAAIPYRDDLARLLLYKEDGIDEAASNQSIGRGEKASGTLEVPAGTHELSVARAFVLVFLSKLPAIDNGLQPRVLSDLLHHLIFQLLDDIRPSGLGIIMLGTPAYVRKMRGWQALCVLSRFVTSDIAERVSTAVFDALGEMLHGQIRYFIEIFTLQCTRSHPLVFGNALVEQLTRRDLSLQQIASLMIISGNLIVGRYELEFFRQYETGGEHAVRLNLVLSGVIPALSSTQGFSRSIAQLLVHKLIPLVIDVDSSPSGPGTEDSDWYLRSLYSFLDENSEMKRLRKKQAKFFSRYEVDTVCTPEGVLSIPVDEGGESVPLHMVRYLLRPILSGLSANQLLLLMHALTFRTVIFTLLYHS